MATPTNRTMFNYFTKLPSKASVVEENPRKTAPIFNKQHVEEFQNRLEQFDLELSGNNASTNYFSSIDSQAYKPYKTHKTCRGSLRARLFQFQEDVRPPYFGTWQKTSLLVTGRRPFGTDKETFDYDVDSEAEWDLGGPGESLKGDDSEDDEELDDYEIDMQTFVPHGYVSDDEVDVNSDNDGNRSEDCDSNLDVKLRQPVDQQTAPPAPKQTPKMDIKPIIVGLNFEESPSISESKLQFLRAFQGISCI